MTAGQPRRVLLTLEYEGTAYAGWQRQLNGPSVQEELERALEARGIDVFVDDRDERPGVKFKDADLIGCTVRVVVGTRGLEKGGVEVRLRKTGETSLVPIADAPAAIAALLASR